VKDLLSCGHQQRGVAQMTTSNQIDTATKAMILKFLGGRTDDNGVEQVARFMARTLRVGRIGECRAFIRQALEA
jgi:hypothetical protein